MMHVGVMGERKGARERKDEREAAGRCEVKIYLVAFISLSSKSFSSNVMWIASKNLIGLSP